MDRAISGGVFRGSCGLRKSLGSLSGDEWARVPTVLLVWAATSKHWVLVGLLGGARSCCQSSSLQRAHSSEYSPIPTPPVWATATPAFPWGPFQDQHVGLAQAYEVTAFPRDSGAHKTACIFQNGASVYPSPVEDCNQAPLAFKAKCCSSHCQTPPKLGCLRQGSELSFL